MTGTSVLIAFFFAGLGFTAGLAHFALLKRAVAALLREGTPTGLLFLLPRLPLTVLILGLSVTGGSVSLLAALMGFVAARMAALHQELETCP